MQACPERHLLFHPFADVATSHDLKPFFLALEARFDPRFGISVVDLSSTFHDLKPYTLYIFNGVV